MSSMTLDQIADVAGILAVWPVPLVVIYQQQRSDHKELSAKIDQIIWHLAGLKRPSPDQEAQP